MYHLAFEDVEEESEEEEDYDRSQKLAQIPVYALAGIADFQTLRVTGHYGKNKFQVLLETGSTYNLLTPLWHTSLDVS